MAQKKKVRFIRKNGRIIPIGVKKSQGQKNAQNRAKLMSARASQGSALGSLAGAGAVFGLSTRPTIEKAVKKKTITMSVAGQSKAFDVAKGVSRKLKFKGAVPIPLAGLFALYGGVAGSLAGSLAGGAVGAIEGESRFPRVPKRKKRSK